MTYLRYTLHGGLSAGVVESMYTLISASTPIFIRTPDIVVSQSGYSRDLGHTRPPQVTIFMNCTRLRNVRGYAL